MKRKFGIALNYRHTIGAGVAIHLNSLFGVSVRRMRGSDNLMYLCAIGWYPQSLNRLGYWQLSCRSL